MNQLRSRSLHSITQNHTFFRQIRLPQWDQKNHTNYSSAAAQVKSEEEEEVEEIEIDQRKLPADYVPATFDPTEHRRPPPERVFRLVDEIAALNLMEVSELSQILMKKLGISELPTMAVMKPGTSPVAASFNPASGKDAAQPEAKAEKTAYDLRLEGFDAASKIKVIKEVRAITDLGLKEAKELVEKAPAVLRKGLTKEEGDQIVEKLKAAGAKAVLE